MLSFAPTADAIRADVLATTTTVLDLCARRCRLKDWHECRRRLSRRLTTDKLVLQGDSWVRDALEDRSVLLDLLLADRPPISLDQTVIDLIVTECVVLDVERSVRLSQELTTIIRQDCVNDEVVRRVV
jgi:hypothetical protein